MLLGYARVSTADQANGTSIDTQTNVIEGLAKIRGVNKYDICIYTDPGVSGAVPLKDRPGGADLLAAMRPGDVVVASKLDRMFRSASDALNMFEEFKARGVELILYDISHEPISSGVGKLIMTVLAAVGDMERERIRERTMDGRKFKKANGGPIGCVPFGYKKEGQGRSAILVANESETRAKARIHELSQTGLSLRGISALLYAEGFAARSGKPYSPNVVRDVLIAHAPQPQ